MSPSPGSQKAPAWQALRIAVNGRDAAIERRFLAHIFQFVGQPSVAIECDQDGWRHRIFLEMHEIAEAVALVIGAGHAHRDTAGDRRIDIRLAPEAIEAAIGRGNACREAIELRLLGNDVDRAARFAAAEQRRGRAFQDLDPLDIRCVANSAIPA